MENEQEYGNLIVKVTTARGVLPLEGATVLISDDENKNQILYSLRTGNDGLTPKVRLPAPPRSLSEAPSTDGEKVYASYNILTSMPGYYSVENVRAPIFSGITSFQTVDLVPVADGASYDIGMIRPGGPQYVDESQAPDL